MHYTIVMLFDTKKLGWPSSRFNSGLVHDLQLIWASRESETN